LVIAQVPVPPPEEKPEKPDQASPGKVNGEFFAGDTTGYGDHRPVDALDSRTTGAYGYVFGDYTGLGPYHSVSHGFEMPSYSFDVGGPIGLRLTIDPGDTKEEFSFSIGPYLDFGLTGTRLDFGSYLAFRPFAPRSPVNFVTEVTTNGLVRTDTFHLMPIATEILVGIMRETLASGGFGWPY
jgi:hypothetical protein